MAGFPRRARSRHRPIGPCRPRATSTASGGARTDHRSTPPSVCATAWSPGRSPAARRCSRCAVDSRSSGPSFPELTDVTTKASASSTPRPGAPPNAAPSVRSSVVPLVDEAWPVPLETLSGFENHQARTRPVCSSGRRRHGGDRERLRRRRRGRRGQGFRHLPPRTGPRPQPGRRRSPPRSRHRPPARSPSRRRGAGAARRAAASSSRPSLGDAVSRGRRGCPRLGRIRRSPDATAGPEPRGKWCPDPAADRKNDATSARFVRLSGPTKDVGRCRSRSAYPFAVVVVVVLVPVAPAGTG